MNPTEPTGPARSGRASQAGSSIEKTARVLHELASGNPRRLADIASGAEVSKPTAHRILSVLTTCGYATPTDAGQYRAGARLRALGAEITGGEDRDDDIDTILATLAKRVGHTVHVGVRAGNCAVYTHKVDSAQPYQMASRVGMRLPLHSTAIGRCILANLPAAELDDVLTNIDLTAYTSQTITDSTGLHAELDRVRERGWALDDGHNETAVRCIAAPLLDGSGTPVGALSISTLAKLTPISELADAAPLVIDAACQIAPLAT